MNRLATRSMLAVTRLPSATTPGRVANLLSSSTSSATALVAGAPEPMATPMSASLSASTSLTPSPVMATVCPRACSAWTMDCFWCGVTRPKTWCCSSWAPSGPGSSGRSRASMASPAWDTPARADGARAVAGDHLERHALGGEVGDGLGGVGSQPLREHDEGHRVQAVGERLAVQGPGGVRQREDPLPGGGQVCGLRQQLVLAAGQDD